MAVFTAIGLAPIVIMLAAAACSSDSTATTGGPTLVDPGGTFGAEVTIVVKGRGRVTGAGFDCPSDCFAKYIFASPSADGAAGGVSLKAIPTPNSGFLGWTFETDQIGSRGRGPDSCNPILRAASQPPVSASAQEITLPFGETTGTPPKGQEGACGAYTKVPVVYKIVANFEGSTPVVPDSGPDVDPTDGGTDQIVFNAPQAGATGLAMGFTQTSYLYWTWRLNSTGFNGISYSSNPATSSTTPTTPTTIVQPTATFTQFEVDQYGVAYQTSTNAIFIIRHGLTTPTSVGGAVTPPTCSALSVDQSYNVYCRSSAGALIQWQYNQNYTTANTLYTGLLSGTDLLVESAFGSAYFSTSSAINSLSLSPTPDGGLGTPTTVVSGRFNPSGLEANGSHFWWLEGGDSFFASSTKSTPTTATDTAVPFATLSHVAIDPSSSTSFWVGSSSAIYHAYYLGGTQTQTFKTNLFGIGGLASDYTYVYWTQSDGTVHRASRSGF